MNAIDLTNHEALYQAMQALLTGPGDDYARLNALRDWTNAHFPTFEFYLEDVWNEHVEGQTRFEYILRSRKTLNETEVLGYDIYKNHRDANGVWHLDDYASTTRLLDDCRLLVNFIRENQ